MDIGQDASRFSPRTALRHGPSLGGTLRGGVVALVLVILTWAVFSPVVGYRFISYDDDVYVTANGQVRDGLSLRGLRWALTTSYAANWHPLTWLSHQLDAHLYGLDPRGHHLTSVLLHLANTALLFFLLLRLSGAMLTSAGVASLFAVHPLHVESVAWIAERKDVLSAFFFMLTLRAYAGYVGKPGFLRWVTVAASLALGLASKPMLVTVPFLLLVLDWWPLGRWRRGGAGPAAFPRLVLEKVPLFLLSAASATVTYLVQSRSGALAMMEFIPLRHRAANALVDYATYLWRTVRPLDLAFFYPHPGQGVSYSRAGLSAAVLGGITVLALANSRRRPYLAAGWLWYLGMLLPVIGLVQTGAQASADRYTYLPLTGLFLSASWTFLDTARQGRAVRGVAALLLVAAVLVLGVLSRRQMAVWRDSETLFRHALSVTKENWMAESSLGTVLAQDNRTEEAIGHYREALRISPAFTKARYNLGLALTAQRKYDEAIQQFHAMLKANPASPDANYGFGKALELQGRFQEALERYREVLRSSPDDPSIHNAIGYVLSRLGRHQDAEKQLLRALQLKADYPEALNNLGIALAGQGRRNDAVVRFRRALQLRPDFAEAMVSLGNVSLVEERLAEAIAFYRNAVHRSPELAVAHNNLGVALYRSGDTQGALREYGEALRLDPGYSEARYNAEAAVRGLPDPSGHRRRSSDR